MARNGSRRQTASPKYRYRRPILAVDFPSDAEMPESKQHLDLRTALYLVLRLAFGESANMGYEQFVYWNPREAQAFR